ncbi:ABC transporter [Altererythrobacter xixiisoli]|uniref:ABC transporter n=1 Tax=Croceibacterium xixiisoli TaxID=1476466 RepID=A0A6I4TPP5_9SPHN|nr:ABC-type transport auxiliary lipoprotein family protein [Croceibacterium xixiisoli]MXO98115.1 ABC transporter [Croceibacterium xixiisoli]
MQNNHNRLRAVLAAAFLPALLTACVSFGAKPPETLLTMRAEKAAPAGAVIDGRPQAALAVFEPTAPRKLDVTRVPVAVSDSSLAYLKDAQWVEKPTRLFQRLLAETLRAQGTRLIIDSGDAQYSATNRLSGNLIELGYDTTLRSVVMQYDAVQQMPDGSLRTRRFEHVVPNIEPDVASVGPALNQAANNVAAQVVAWVQ